MRRLIILAISATLALPLCPPLPIEEYKPTAYKEATAVPCVRENSNTPTGLRTNRASRPLQLEYG